MNAVDGGPPAAAEISRRRRSSRRDSVTDAARMSPPPDDGRHDEVNVAALNSAVAGGPLVADVAGGPSVTAVPGGPSVAEIRREDQPQSGADATVWRCLGPTPVARFSVEYRNLLGGDYRRNFRVQPILSSGVVLPPVNVVVK